MLKFDAIAAEAQSSHMHSFPWPQGKAGMGAMPMSSAARQLWHAPIPIAPSLRSPTAIAGKQPQELRRE